MLMLNGNKLRMKRIIIAGFLIIGILQANAQGVLTLEEAINIALKNSLDIRISRNNLEANIISNHISIAGGLPQVDLSVNQNRALTNLSQNLSNGTEIKRRGNATRSTTSGIAGSFLLFNGFRVHAAKTRLQALEKQSEQQINVQIQNVIANVMVKYYDIVRQDSYIKTIRQSIEVTLQRKKLVDARQSVGLANNADTYQACLKTLIKEGVSNFLHCFYAVTNCFTFC